VQAVWGPPVWSRGGAPLGVWGTKLKPKNFAQGLILPLHRRHVTAYAISVWKFDSSCLFFSTARPIYGTENLIVSAREFELYFNICCCWWCQTLEWSRRQLSWTRNIIWRLRWEAICWWEASGPGCLPPKFGLEKCPWTCRYLRSESLKDETHESSTLRAVSKVMRQNTCSLKSVSRLVAACKVVQAVVKGNSQSNGKRQISTKTQNPWWDFADT